MKYLHNCKILTINNDELEIVYTEEQNSNRLVREIIIFKDNKYYFKDDNQELNEYSRWSLQDQILLKINELNKFLIDNF